MSFMPADTELEAFNPTIFTLAHCMAPKVRGDFLVLSLLSDMGYSITFQFAFIVYKKTKVDEW